MIRIKHVVWVALLAVIIIGVLVFLKCNCAAPVEIKEGWTAPKTEKTSGPPATWMPWHKPTKADTLLKGWPRGTRVIEVAPQEKPVYIAVPPQGPIQIPNDTEGVTVYEKPAGVWGFETRPFLGAGVDYTNEIAPAAVAGIDILNIWRVHTGPGICVDSGAFSGLWTASYGIWRNIDARAGGGYGTDGPVGFAGLTIGIE